MIISLAVAACFIAGNRAFAAPLVVETDPLTPEEQRLKFHLPPGFEIQLILSEPDIGQPMNVSFDAAGRLWVTSSVEYPYPARGDGVQDRPERFGAIGDHDPRDRVTIVEGIGPDGKPAKVTQFVSGLNIPIGQLPVPDGAIVFSIPNITHWRDTDGDGEADEHETLYGPFGNVDTHGMVNSFTRWIDGWVYACHGFSNKSAPVARDGQGITMQSGNSFRFREDGSRIEQITWGQVNPFGLTFDPWGNEYTADCHSMPITCLVRGAYYSSFGKPHDGLGFGPDMITHDHGSTGICGAAWYDAEQYPEEFRGCIYICNPVNGQVHRDRIEWDGSSPRVVTQPEFVTCDDGWFRPVYVTLGPDGALYIADFYNAIIGHYEVPLEHPRRDREKGRVWRVVYTGREQRTESREQSEVLPDLTSLELSELIARLGDSNLTTRTLVTNLICDRFAKEATESLAKLLQGTSSASQRAHALWVLERLGSLTGKQWEAAAGDSEPLVRTHVARILAERADWGAEERAASLRLLQDTQPMVRRAAADAVGRHPRVDNVATLLQALAAAEEHDTHLRHTVRIALRNHVAVDEIARSPAVAALMEGHADALVDVALGAPTPGAAALIVQRLTRPVESNELYTRLLQHAARYAADDQLRSLAQSARVRSTGDAPAEIRDLNALAAGCEQRGMAPVELLGDWARQLAEELLSRRDDDGIGWTESPLPGRRFDGEIFAPETRRCSDGIETELLSSLPRGEQRTGFRRSEPFELPTAIRFYLAGHDGTPPAPPSGNNFVRLRDAETNALLAESPTPRNDMAQKIEWDLSTSAGRRGYIEIVDADDRGAFAWLAIGRFSTDGLNPRPFSPIRAATGLVARLRLEDFAPRLAGIAADQAAPLPARISCAESVLALKSDARLAALLPLAGDRSVAAELREGVFAALGSRDETAIGKVLTDAMRYAAEPQQRQMAFALSGDKSGAEALLTVISAGQASPRLLTDPAIAQRVEAALGDGGAAQIAELTMGLPARSEELDKLIADRRGAFAAGTASAERGRAVFKKHCAACHQLAGEGNKIGPQLDGIGVRGPDRLLEDILDPNRNVDAAFRTTVIVDKDGKVLTGLVRREEGPLLVLADTKGEEFKVAKDNIDEQSISPLSLMPANHGEVIPEAELLDLVARLLEATALQHTTSEGQ
jgi:putative heme-binding domain-containing protein